MKQKGLWIGLKTAGLFVILFTPGFLLATTYYVDPNHSTANDNNSGILNSPWLTIQHAAETAVAGDTVFIRNSVYNEHIYINNNGDATNGYIVFSAYPGEKPVLDGTGVTVSVNGINLDKSYIKLIGLEIRNWDDTGIWIENASYIEIADCEVHDVFYGIGAADGTHDFEFNRVNVHHFTGYGFDVSPSGGGDCYNGTFNDCVAHTGRDTQQNVDGFALGHGNQHSFVFNRCITYNVFDGFDISSGDTKLDRCLSYNCWNGCYKLWQDKISMVNCIGYSSSSAIVELDWDGEPGTSTLMNCTFYNSELYIVWVENPGDTLKMYNCILAGGDNIGLAFEQRHAGNYKGDYNLFHNETDRAIAVGYEDEFTLNQVESGAWLTYSGQDSHSLVSYTDTSLFIDPLNFDLHLSKTSLAIDKGTTVSAPSDDYDGNPRPQGTGFDIGAFEYLESTGMNGDLLLNSMPKNFMLLQNYPNPFNASTVIKFALLRKEEVMIEVFNALGQKVATLLDQQMPIGFHDVEFNAKGLPTGLYIFRIFAGQYQAMKKMLYLR